MCVWSALVTIFHVQNVYIQNENLSCTAFLSGTALILNTQMFVRNANLIEPNKITNERIKDAINRKKKKKQLYFSK